MDYAVSLLETQYPVIAVQIPTHTIKSNTSAPNAKRDHLKIVNHVLQARLQVCKILPTLEAEVTLRGQQPNERSESSLGIRLDVELYRHREPGVTCTLGTRELLSWWVPRSLAGEETSRIQGRIKQK